MNGWNLTNSEIEMGILMQKNTTSLDLFDISASVILGRHFLSSNGPWQGQLCHADTFLVLIAALSDLSRFAIILLKKRVCAG